MGANNNLKTSHSERVKRGIARAKEAKRLAVHFSSKSDDWETPQAFFDQIQDEFRLNWDVCADESNAKLGKFKYFSKEDDGLSKDWSGLRCWMNPPYGREIGKWVKKASQGGQRS